MLDKETILLSIASKVPPGFSASIDDDGGIWIRKDGTVGSETNFWHVTDIGSRDALEWVIADRLPEAINEADVAQDVRHIPHETTLRAIALWNIENRAFKRFRTADHHLMAATGCSPEEAYWAMILLAGHQQGCPHWLEWGVSARTGWLNSEGEKALATFAPDLSEVYLASRKQDRRGITGHAQAQYAGFLKRLPGYSPPRRVEPWHAARRGSRSPRTP